MACHVEIKRGMEARRLSRELRRRFNFCQHRSSLASSSACGSNTYRLRSIRLSEWILSTCEEGPLALKNFGKIQMGFSKKKNFEKQLSVKWCLAKQFLQRVLTAIFFKIKNRSQTLRSQISGICDCRSRSHDLSPQVISCGR